MSSLFDPPWSDSWSAYLSAPIPNCDRLAEVQLQARDAYTTLDYLERQDVENPYFRVLKAQMKAIQAETSALQLSLQCFV